jgi:hypothetical protein
MAWIGFFGDFIQDSIEESVVCFDKRKSYSQFVVKTQKMWLEE